MGRHHFFSHEFAGRHSRHGWHKHFGGLESGRGWGDMFRAGRMLAAGDIRLIVLALLEEKPRHGYDIIKAIEQRTSGFYAPSPGVVYPTLTYLEEIGHTEVESEAGKKLYRITGSGRNHLAEHRDEADAVMGQLTAVGGKMAQMRSWFGEESAGTEDAYDGLHDAKRMLRDALRAKRGASADELKRVAGILLRAAKEIGGQ
jgi:DNA-binding PadR family transcriptional regulator